MGTLSPEHVRIFLTVVESGSFSAASRVLRRSQTGISYAVTNLEAQLGVQLFERQGRRATLTPAGIALVPEAHKIMHSLQNIRMRADAIARGIEPELALAIDAYFSPADLAQPMQEFAEMFPQVRLMLHQEMIGNAIALVADGVCSLGIVSHAMSLRPEFQTTPMPQSIRLIPVVAREHPLAQMRTDLRNEDLGEHIQLLSILNLDQAYGALSQRQWHCSDLQLQREMLYAGIGWSALPEYLVREDLLSGRIVALSIASWGYQARTDFAMSVINLSDGLLGPATRWMLARLTQ